MLYENTQSLLSISSGNGILTWLDSFVNIYESYKSFESKTRLFCQRALPGTIGRKYAQLHMECGKMVWATDRKGMTTVGRPKLGADSYYYSVQRFNVGFVLAGDGVSTQGTQISLRLSKRLYGAS